MTPIILHQHTRQGLVCHREPLTERMPDDQGQLRHLFSLLAQFHECSFAAGWFHQLGHPLQDLAVLFTDAAFHRSVALAHILRNASLVRGVVIDCDAIVMLLLSSRRSSGSRLSLGMLLSSMMLLRVL